MVMLSIRTPSVAGTTQRAAVPSSTAVRAIALGKGFFRGATPLRTAPRMPSRPVSKTVGVQALFGGAAVDNKTFYDFTVTVGL